MLNWIPSRQGIHHTESFAEVIRYNGSIEVIPTNFNENSQSDAYKSDSRQNAMRASRSEQGNSNDGEIDTCRASF